MKMRKMLLDNGEKKGDLCYKLAESLVNCVCVLVFCGRQNLPVMEVDVQLRRFVHRVLTEWLGSS